MPGERKPFDPTEPFDAMAETIRREIVDVALRAMNTTIYRDMDAHRQLECFVSGAMTAIVGVCFSSIHPEGRDYMIEYLGACWPQAREMAENIMETGASHG